MSAPAPGSSPAPWYTQFWPWFILGLLGTSMLGSLVSVTLAVRGADPEVPRNHAADAKAIHELTEAEDFAASLGMGALLSIDDSGRMLSLESWAQATDVPPALLVHFAHPTRVADDRTVLFTRGRDGVHRAEIDQAMNGRWEVVVSSAAGRGDAGRWEIMSQANLHPGAEVALGSPRPGPG